MKPRLYDCESTNSNSNSNSSSSSSSSSSSKRPLQTTLARKQTCTHLSGDEHLGQVDNNNDKNNNNTVYSHGSAVPLAIKLVPADPPSASASHHIALSIMQHHTTYQYGLDTYTCITVPQQQKQQQQHSRAVLSVDSGSCHHHPKINRILRL
jgi:hypothetical protein